MKAVVTLSKKFFSNHPRKGEETLFREKVLSGSKRHTCRSNYEYWKEKIERLKEVGGILSVRQWSANPYRSPQEIVTDIPAELVGVQKLELCRMKVETYDELLNVGTYYYTWSAKVEGYNIPVSLLAQNDGLTKDEFKAWFTPVFDEAEKKYSTLASVSNATILEFAIIHFTEGKY